MRLTPLGDRIIAKQLEAQETTKSGLLLTGQAKEKPQEAIVVAVSPSLIPCERKVNKGDHILIPPYGHMEVKFEGETYLIMHEGDILATIGKTDSESCIVVKEM